MNQHIKKNQGLICSYLLDEKGNAKSIGWEEVNSWKPQHGFLWVDIDFSDAHAKQWLEQKANLSPIIVEALLIKVSRPRSLAHENGLLVISRSVNLMPGAKPDELISTRTWLEDQRIITVQQYRSTSIHDMETLIQNKKAPRNAGEFLSTMISFMVDKIADVIDDLVDRMDELETKTVKQKTPSAVIQKNLALIRRETIELHRYLSPQRESLARLTTMESKFIKGNDKASIKEDMNRIMRFLEDLSALRERALVTYEELTNQLAIQTNNRMYLLSLVAVLFLPLTFLTGLLGTNVGGIPGSHSPWGFAAVLTFIAIFFMIELWLFRKKRWF